MCGIVGYLGNYDSREFILDGLKKLEYRGYDSAGVAFLDQSSKEIKIYKQKGRVKKLEKHIDFDFDTTVGIGHTRWATHGKPNKTNSHPHSSEENKFVIVHNGVIENYKELKDRYLKEVQFKSETDTEVIANLIEFFSKTLSVDESIRKAISLLEGSYALVIMDNQNPDTLYAAKNKSPMLLGFSSEGTAVASDLMALVSRCEEYLPIDDKVFVEITRNTVQLYDIIGTKLSYEPIKIDVDSEAAELGSYPHFMIKEIEEQPSVIRRILSEYIDEDKINIKKEIINDVKKCDRIYIVAAGTSMNAGCIGKILFERGAKKPVEVHVASEFAYNMPIISENPLFVLVSQSGETADLRTVLVNIKAKGYRSLTLTNVRTSTLAREANNFLNIYAGPEIAVASTKAYLAEICVLSILVHAIDKKKYDIVKELSKVASSIEKILEQKEYIRNLVEKNLTKRNCFYIGRGIDYYASIEAALKLKEVSYIQTEGFAAGELKHGTIALIEEGTPVIAIITQKNISKNTRSNLEEVRSRGANTLIISSKSCSEFNDDIIVDDVYELYSPLLTIVPTQLISYYAALQRGYDIDKPRNLAKSVTVE